MAGSWIFSIHKKESVRVCPLNLRYRLTQHDTSACVELHRNGVVSQGRARENHEDTRSEQQRQDIQFHRRYIFTDETESTTEEFLKSLSGTKYCVYKQNSEGRVDETSGKLQYLVQSVEMPKASIVAGRLVPSR